ncbi:hypothetical protein DCAR_0520338 [Daucus carota subsp. sativus]|nr:PREDICTED: protein IQ-DOMAIN 1-like [Daucus carota subsp. sativus]XP_017251816.1 PREDICTED: protein IQ-DOMAIN 1-like [Daucus carota subsp. sativus]XP_017251823.1 PREDICTED: protein IQ-DOMAIN 1-like [Daucus carota subsp. sativus]WOH00960.1 hypothetical protein DCAR_0520338 [Daucus carota subsp. sativus]
MGRKGIACFSSVKKAFSTPKSKEKKNQKWKKWFRKQTSLKRKSSLEACSTPQNRAQLPQIHTTGIVRPITVSRVAGKSREEVAAIKIQTAYRGYTARRTLRALRGLVRLKSVVNSAAVKRQTTNTLQTMQGVSRVQYQINSRRIRMSEENQVLQKQLLRKRAKQLESLQMEGEWNRSSQSKEQIEAKLLSKYEATMRRERAMAYSFSHQQTRKKSARSTNQLFMDPANPQWGWSWLDRWVAARPESKTEKEFTDDHSSVKGGRRNFAGNAMAKSHARPQLICEKPMPACYSRLYSPRNHLSPSTPVCKVTSPKPTRRLKLHSPGASVLSIDYDSKSMFSIDSELNRRQTIAGSSVRDDESLVSSPSIPRYMAATHSAKAKSRTQSLLSMENGTLAKKSAGYGKKQLSYPASPARATQHFSHPSLDSPSIADNNVSDIAVN